MDNLDDKHLDMLRSNLSVYEVDGIQCQLTFEKKTMTLEVSIFDDDARVFLLTLFLLVHGEQLVRLGTREEQSGALRAETHPRIRLHRHCQ